MPDQYELQTNKDNQPKSVGFFESHNITLVAEQIEGIHHLLYAKNILAGEITANEWKVEQSARYPDFAFMKFAKDTAAGVPTLVLDIYHQNQPSHRIEKLVWIQDLQTDEYESFSITRDGVFNEELGRRGTPYHGKRDEARFKRYTRIINQLYTDLELVPSRKEQGLFGYLGGLVLPAHQ